MTVPTSPDALELVAKLDDGSPDSQTLRHLSVTGYKQVCRDASLSLVRHSDGVYVVDVEYPWNRDGYVKEFASFTEAEADYDDALTRLIDEQTALTWQHDRDLRSVETHLQAMPEDLVNILNIGRTVAREQLVKMWVEYTQLNPRVCAVLIEAGSTHSWARTATSTDIEAELMLIALQQ